MLRFLSKRSRKWIDKLCRSDLLLGLIECLCVEKGESVRIYLGGAMFTYADIVNNLRLAKKLRENGFTVYCPNENEGINDKTRTDITAEKIYMADIIELENSNIFLCQISEDSGTMWEAGYMDCLSKNVDSKKYFGVIGLATDIRLQTTPDLMKRGIDNQSMYLNQFVIGGSKQSLGVFTDEDELILRLKRLQNNDKDR